MKHTPIELPNGGYAIVSELGRFMSPLLRRDGRIAVFAERDMADTWIRHCHRCLDGELVDFLADLPRRA